MNEYENVENPPKCSKCDKPAVKMCGYLGSFAWCDAPLCKDCKCEH